ncbi:MAG: hypothetical protein KDK70_19480, partial [Myxococcales bacterium]|nr:hypothetical protein [Myxococcales bacterium]
MGSAGCQPPLPELSAEGRRVAVGVQAEVDLCAGTLRAWDEHVGFVEAQLGIARDPDRPIEVYVVEDTEPWCNDVMACYIGGSVDATVVPAYEPRAIWHELVHHVVSGSDRGLTDRFLSEGMAGALGDSWCPNPGTAWPEPSLSQLLARDDVAYEHYPRATQFVDFVRAEHGPGALVALVECIERGDPLDAVEDCLQHVLHADLPTLDARFGAATPALHGNPALCRGEAVPWDGPTWAFEAALACEDPAVENTFRSPHGRQTAALVEIAEPGEYAAQLRADGDATLEIEPCFCPTEAASLLHDPDSGSVWVGEPGLYRLVFRTADPTTSRLRV